jgi:hypothetical protein
MAAVPEWAVGLELTGLFVLLGDHWLIDAIVTQGKVLEPKAVTAVFYR